MAKVSERDHSWTGNNCLQNRNWKIQVMSGIAGTLLDFSVLILNTAECQSKAVWDRM